MIMEPKGIRGDHQTLVDLLRWRAINQPEQRAYVFLKNGEEEEDVLTYAQLDRQARNIAALLQKYDAYGQRALLLYRPGLEYMAAFFGCLYAGAIAVPTYPPGTNQHGSNRLNAIVADAQPVIALTTQSILTSKHFAAYKTEWSGLPLEITDQCDDLADQWRAPAIDGQSLAFLQYTSGSTGIPKGVMVSYHNLLSNHAILAEAFQHPAGVPFISWLPLFHDLGLIGKALQAVYLGAPCVLMSPAAFVQKPYRWLAAISRYRAYSSYAPNFAYELCIRKITPEQRVTLDLSCWKIALNGAEPVLADTLEHFTETFAACGFRYEAFHPAYGLADRTKRAKICTTRKTCDRTASGVQGCSERRELRPYLARATGCYRQS
jgi:acyl-CoA synthetase (AMP-forming)/AMP-acid ligase II